MPDFEPHEGHHLLYDIAERTNGSDKSRPTPHIGPGFEDYQKEWQKTVGGSSDEWWAEVSRPWLFGWHRVELTLWLGRWQTSISTGSHLSRLFAQVDSSTVTFNGCK